MIASMATTVAAPAVAIGTLGAMYGAIQNQGRGREHIDPIETTATGAMIGTGLGVVGLGLRFKLGHYTTPVTGTMTVNGKTISGDTAKILQSMGIQSS